MMGMLTMTLVREGVVLAPSSRRSSASVAGAAIYKEEVLRRPAPHTQR